MKNLILILLIATSMAACNSKTSQKQAGNASATDTLALVLHVERMTCEHCEMTVEGSVKALPGILEVKASHVDSSATLRYLPSEVSVAEIAEAIESKGYKVLGEK